MGTAGRRYRRVYHELGRSLEGLIAGPLIRARAGPWVDPLMPIMILRLLDPVLLSGIPSNATGSYDLLSPTPRSEDPWPAEANPRPGCRPCDSGWQEASRGSKESGHGVHGAAHDHGGTRIHPGPRLDGKEVLPASCLFVGQIAREQSEEECHYGRNGCPDRR